MLAGGPLNLIESSGLGGPSNRGSGAGNPIGGP